MPLLTTSTTARRTHHPPLRYRTLLSCYNTVWVMVCCAARSVQRRQAKSPSLANPFEKGPPSSSAFLNPPHTHGHTPRRDLPSHYIEKKRV